MRGLEFPFASLSSLNIPLKEPLACVWLSSQRYDENNQDWLRSAAAGILLHSWTGWGASVDHQGKPSSCVFIISISQWATQSMVMINGSTGIYGVVSYFFPLSNNLFSQRIIRERNTVWSEADYINKLKQSKRWAAIQMCAIRLAPTGVRIFAEFQCLTSLIWKYLQDV